MAVETQKGRALVLRTCGEDMRSWGGFVWPKEGPAECPDWEPTHECGNGLHGALWGEGDGRLFNWSADAVWQVVEIEEWIDLGGKVKFPRGTVVHTGDQRSATDFIIANGATGPVIGSTLTGWDDSTLTGGDRSTLTGGDRSTLTGGDDSTLTGGDRSTLTGGDYSTLTGGHCSTLTGGDRSTLTGGYCSTLTGGDYSTLSISWYDGLRRRISIAYVGEDGIQTDTPYRLDEYGKFVEAR